LTMRWDYSFTGHRMDRNSCYAAKVHTIKATSPTMDTTNYFS
jgi:hypothetical protein